VANFVAITGSATDITCRLLYICRHCERARVLLPAGESVAAHLVGENLRNMKRRYLQTRLNAIAAVTRDKALLENRCDARLYYPHWFLLFTLRL